MIEDSAGKYKQSTTSTFPGYEYFYNQEKSTCMDMSGKPIADSLLYNQETRTATITIGDTSSCYLYFDTWKGTPNFASKLIDSNVMWQSGLEGDGYRFVGTGAYNTSSTPANFVCFGTTDKSTCTSNLDTYMYRIIGVFDDQVKLIKLSSLTENLSFAPGTMFVQTSDQYRNYPASRLSSLLNSTSFLTNTNYLGDDDYRDMIDTNSKTAVTTSTYSSSGPNYYNSLSPTNIYLHETNRSSKTNTNGYWNTYTDKISVLDVSDYVLSLGDTAKSMTSGTYSNRSTLKTSWLFLGNNKYGNTSGNYTTENTTAVYGTTSSSYTTTIYAWTINPNGYIYYTDKSNAYATRPVFYLKKDITSNNGTGTLSDPYLIDEVPKGININLSNTDNILSIKITDDYSTQLKYCVNKSSSINGCEWKNVNSSNISYNMSDGTYYVHVIDSLGYINHNSFSYVASDSYNFVLAIPNKYSDLTENYHNLHLMPSAEELGTRPDVSTGEDITVYGVKAENVPSSDIINTTEDGIISFPSDFKTQNSFPSLFDALYTWYNILTAGDFSQFEYKFYTPYSINNARYDGIYLNTMFGDNVVNLDYDEDGTYWIGYKWIFYEVPPGSDFDVLNPDSQYRINFVAKEDTNLLMYQLINNVKLHGNYTYYGIYEYDEEYDEVTD